jgi:hypothetical protein
MDEGFHQKLQSRCKIPGGEILTYDEVIGWPPGYREDLEKAGKIRQIENSEEIPCNQCPEGCLISPLIRTDPITGNLVGTGSCPDDPDIGRFEVDLDRRRQWEIVNETPQNEGKSTVQHHSQEVEWDENATEYIPNSDAIKLSGGKISLTMLSKILKPDGTIRYMKKSQRCKVHIRDFQAYIKTLKKDITDTDIENYLAGVEKRKAEIREKKIK